MCKDNPEISSLIPGNIRVTLLRKATLWMHTRREIEHKRELFLDTIIGHGEIVESMTGTPGVLILKGNIGSGDPGSESSWSVHGVAEVSVRDR